MNWVYFLIAGIVGGILGGMGMGGGTLLIPILTLILDMPQLQAQALNLISFVPMALVCLIIHIKNKLVDLKKILYLAPTAVMSCIIGAFFSDKIGGDILKKIFGVFMVVIGTTFLLKMIINYLFGFISSHKHNIFIKKYAKKAEKRNN